MDNAQLQESDILTALFSKPRELHAYILKIEPDFFSDHLRGFYSVFQEYYSKYGKSPSQSVYKIEFEGEEQTRMFGVYNAIQQNFDKLKDVDQTYLISKIDLFVKKSFIKRTLLQSYDEFEAGEYDKIIRNFSRLNEAVIDTEMGKNYFDPEFFTSKYDREKTGININTGSNQFDENFGGLHRKTLSIVAGPSNSGKTMFLVNLTGGLLELTDQLKNILYITLEIDEESIAKRVDANLLCIPVKDLWKKIHDTETSEGVIEKFVTLKENRNRLVIKAMRGGSNPSDIEALIRNLSVIPLKGDDRPFKPDVVMIDYLGLLQPNNPSKNMNSYDKGRMISEELRQISQDFNLAMVAAAQTNRNSFGNEVRQENISDSISIVQTADLVLTINRNEELDRVNQLVIYLAKSRFSRTGMKFIFNVDFECMRLNDVDTGNITNIEGIMKTNDNL